MQRNIMGPCWLEIRGGDFDAMQNASIVRWKLWLTDLHK